jgi:hypothetical protein
LPLATEQLVDGGAFVTATEYVAPEGNPVGKLNDAVPAGTG